MKKRVYESGQALVLVLLSLAVVLTIVLFVLARSVTDIAVSSRSEEAVRAFSAAEAGIEQALVIGTGSNGALVSIGNDQYSSNVVGFAQGETSFTFPTPLNSGGTQILWLKSQDTSPDFSGTKVEICWGNDDAVKDTQTTPAIEASLFYETTENSPATTKIYRAAFDPNSSALRDPQNAFLPAATDSSCVVSGKTFPFHAVVDFSAPEIPATRFLQFMRVRMLYNDTPQQVAFVSPDGSVFPSQGQDITSTGVAGGSNRKVQVIQSWSEPPAIFDFAIYSGGGLTK